MVDGAAFTLPGLPRQKPALFLGPPGAQKPKKGRGSKPFYTGDLRDGIAHGHGCTSYGTGDRYEGQHATGIPHGRGTYSWPDGVEYEGKFVQGKAHGHGEYRQPDFGKDPGFTLIRKTKRHGMAPGTGQFKWPNGQEYTGGHREGAPHGTGTYSWPDGTCYRGGYVNGKMEGTGRTEFLDGAQHEGCYAQGKMDGAGTMTFPPGFNFAKAGFDKSACGAIRYEGDFKKDKFHGLKSKLLYQKGQTEVGGWVANYKKGSHVMKNRDGSTRLTQFFFPPVDEDGLPNKTLPKNKATTKLPSIR